MWKRTRLSTRMDAQKLERTQNKKIDRVQKVNLITDVQVKTSSVRTLKEAVKKRTANPRSKNQRCSKKWPTKSLQIKLMVVKSQREKDWLKLGLQKYLFKQPKWQLKTSNWIISYRLFVSDEAVTHPSSSGPVTANVSKPFFMVSIRGTEGHLFDCLIHNEPLRRRREKFIERWNGQIERAKEKTRNSLHGVWFSGLPVNLVRDGSHTSAGVT